MALGAATIFSPRVGRRDPRGIGVGLSLWGTLLTTRAATTPSPLQQSIGVAGLLGALALFNWAAYSIRGRVFSFAGNDDVPQFVHRDGPYAYVRNPFYASYLLAEIAIVVMWPTVWGIALVAGALLYFQWLARYEEEKFTRSPIAADYEVYKASTGRLLPRLWR